MESDGDDTTTLREYFRLDLNAVPACYVLRASDADDVMWSSHYDVMQKQLRDAAVKVLTSRDAEKYRISVTEAEKNTQNSTGASIVCLAFLDLSRLHL